MPPSRRRSRSSSSAARAIAACKATHARLVELTGPPPFAVKMGKLAETVHTFEALRPVILDMAKEGLNLQRFKGLGEMNPISCGRRR